ncbi:MAG TPA: ABC transporter permease subunit, partial [Stellaceae bacterium]|nr:ABC transporter permease subunit [Stellaceae bacterium]
PEIRANLDRVYHLDEPLARQYLDYLGHIARGDFGPSFSYRDFSVNQLIGEGFRASAELGASALVAALVLGLLMGGIAAAASNSPLGRWLDRLIMTLAMTGIAIPSFVVAPILTLVFGVYLAMLPAGGWGNGHQLAYKILPVTALALPQLAVIARLFRAGIIEAWRQPFIRTALAKGLPRWLILARHASKPALLPVLSYLGPATAGIVTGSVVIEQIFSIPGIGRYFVQGALNRDYTLVTGVVIFYGALVILCNLAVDLLYGLLDPRMRIGRR